MPSPAARVAVTDSMNRDPNRFCVWCDLWGMKLNASKTKTIRASRSHTVHPQSTPLTLDGAVLEESSDIVIFGVTFHKEITFEKYLCSVSSAVSSAGYYESPVKYFMFGRSF